MANIVCNSVNGSNPGDQPVFGQGITGSGGHCCIFQGGSGPSSSYHIGFSPSGDFTEGTSCALAENHPGGWASGTFNAADYEVQVSATSANHSGDPLSTWLNLGTARTFSWGGQFVSNSGGQFISPTITIRKASDQTIVYGPYTLERSQIGRNTECI